MFPAFEGLHGNIKIFVLAHSQWKLFKGNDQQSEREQSIVEGPCRLVAAGVLWRRKGQFSG